MQIFPAIDIKNGKAVRLVKGDFTQETIVNEDPVQQAKVFAENGMKQLHLVDLDGAVQGKAANADLISRIKKQTNASIQLGGGLRSLEQIETYLQKGIDRFIIGSAAVKDPEFLKAVLDKYGERIIVGIDAKNEYVATEGWLEVSTLHYLEFTKQMVDLGVKTIVYTDIDRDGTLTGPNFAHYEALVQAFPAVRIIASGGCHAIQDIQQLKTIGAYGVIIGKAYYNGNITLSEMKKEMDEC